MFKRIYSLLISATVLGIQSSYAAPQAPTNIKKIIQKKDKIIVIVHENGKDKQIVLSKDALEHFNKAKTKTTKKEQNTTKKTPKKELVKKEKVEKKSKKKVVKVTKETKTKSKKVVTTKKSIEKTKTVKKVAKKESKKVKTLTKSSKKEHTVTAGDTLFSIAMKYKVSLSDLVALNKLKSTTLIHPGDVLKIPSQNYEESAQKAVATNNKTVYRVKRGDTIYSIAKKYNMKVATLKKLNNFKPHPKIKPGMELTVLGKPVEIKSRKTPKKHVVKRGENLWMIARKYNLSIYQLRLLNPKIRTHSLRVGSVLNISKKEAIKLAKLRKYQKRKKRLSGVLARYQRRGSSGSARNVVAYAKRFLGTRYVWGASRPGAFDCSGFTQYVMKHAKGRMIPRVSRRQAYYGRYVTRRNLRAGDLIFFDTSRRRRGYVNHVGIYIGNGKFIHASSGKHRVVITSLNKPFYRQRFMWGRRIN